MSTVPMVPTESGVEPQAARENTIATAARSAISFFFIVMLLSFGSPALSVSASALPPLPRGEALAIPRKVLGSRQRLPLWGSWQSTVGFD